MGGIMSTKLKAGTATSGAVLDADTSGVLELQSGSTPTTAITVDTSQNVGIGTSSPTAPLHVAKDAGTGIAISILRATGTSNNGLLIDTTNTPDSYLADFRIGNASKMRIDSSGNLLVGTTTATYSSHQINKGTTSGATCLVVGAGSTGIGLFINNVDQNNYSATATAFGGGRASSTGRSINVGGTVNASGADYAEYMTKSGDFNIAKGDVCGIDKNGKLTNVFNDAISFVVKSTDPSYVGGDTWGIDLDEDALEIARQKVDRIAFAGQVPVNVLGATAGQYIIPVDDNGSIKGEAVSNPTFEQYQIAIGKVIAIEADGRAKIIVKVA